MTDLRTSSSLVRIAPAALGVITLAAIVLAIPTPGAARAQEAAGQARAIVRLNDVGTIDATSPMSIVVYTTGGARVGIGMDPPAAVTDTLRLTDRLPAMTADVTDGEVHIEIRSAGTIRMGGKVTGGAATELAATGRHLVLLKGGAGIRTNG